MRKFKLLVVGGVTWALELLFPASLLAQDQSPPSAVTDGIQWGAGRIAFAIIFASVVLTLFRLWYSNLRTATKLEQQAESALKMLDAVDGVADFVSISPIKNDVSP
jgi:hypothetical protein